MIWRGLEHLNHMIWRAGDNTFSNIGSFHMGGSTCLAGNLSADPC
ncbi:unnamed protein product [Staurois parvus]|uniref:Uncharacterized protein n=1 Tax=Staurois parvus TaxID=386267 RepID=A0ABN9CWM4_9NEOB|nr:unnamed protein product [Staurois parvus]